MFDLELLERTLSRGIGVCGVGLRPPSLVGLFFVLFGKLFVLGLGRIGESRGWPRAFPNASVILF